MIAKDVLQSLMDRSTKREDALAQLTARQREVLQLVAEGHSAKEIASLLNISPRTVEFHKYRIMEDLGLRTNADLIQFAVKHGIAGG